MEKSKIFRN